MIELPDQEVAEVYWKNHKSRNNSYITDLFTGQYKNTSKCNCCNYTVRKFEPMTSIIVPIPKLDQPKLPLDLCIEAIKAEDIIPKE